jgi:DNA-binding Lrp family transcriptional regulator
MSDAKVLAFIMIRLQADWAGVVEMLNRQPGVTEVHPIYGDWDIIVKVEVPSLAELTALVQTMRGITGVIKTSTLIALS